MKKLITLAFALVAFASCSKEELVKPNWNVTNIGFGKIVVKTTSKNDTLSKGYSLLVKERPTFECLGEDCIIQINNKIYSGRFLGDY